MWIVDFLQNLIFHLKDLEIFGSHSAYRVSGHNGQVFDSNFPSLGERCVETEVMRSTRLI